MDYIINIVNLVAIKIYSFSYESWNYRDNDRNDRQEIEHKSTHEFVLKDID